MQKGVSVVLENGTEEFLYRSKKNDGYWEKTIGNRQRDLTM